MFLKSSNQENANRLEAAITGSYTFLKMLVACIDQSFSIIEKVYIMLKLNSSEGSQAEHTAPGSYIKKM